MKKMKDMSPKTLISMGMHLRCAFAFTNQGPPNLNQESMFEDFIDFWRYISTKWLRQRTHGSNAYGIAFEGPGVESLRSAACREKRDELKVFHGLSLEMKAKAIIWP